MKKATMYEIKVYRETYNGGYFLTVGYALTENAVNAVIEEYKTEHQVYDYRMMYSLDDDKNIKFYVEEVDVKLTVE